MGETSTQTKGLLLAMMQPPPSMEEEFQDWYDTEHFPERATTEGFLTAGRFICLEGWPRYLALYDLANPDVLHGAAYARIAGARYSPWTRRIVPRVWGHYRAEGVQVYPGDALFGAKGNSTRVVLWRFRHVPSSAESEIVKALRTVYEGRAETAQVRVFVAKQAAGTDYLGIVELHAPAISQSVDMSPFGDSSRFVDMINTYARYDREWPVFPTAR
jgi:hypothetical protein